MNLKTGQSYSICLIVSDNGMNQLCISSIYLSYTLSEHLRLAYMYNLFRHTCNDGCVGTSRSLAHNSLNLLLVHQCTRCKHIECIILFELDTRQAYNCIIGIQRKSKYGTPYAHYVLILIYSLCKQLYMF